MHFDPCIFWVDILLLNMMQDYMFFYSENNVMYFSSVYMYTVHAVFFHAELSTCIYMYSILKFELKVLFLYVNIFA